MLASEVEDVAKLTYPQLITPKIDGIRCLIIDGKAVSRKFKAIPNHHIRNTLERDLAHLQLDGEIIVGTTFNESSSAVMSHDGEPEFTFLVFDYIDEALTKPYHERMTALGLLKLPAYCKKLLPHVVNSADEMNATETIWTSQGYEGVMTRGVNSPYKCGRSSVKEGYLLKIKRFADSEATILGFEEKMSNKNIAEKDAFGRTKRSKKKEGMVGANTLGAFIVKDVITNVEFRVATGLTDEMRDMIWKDRDSYLGKLIKYKHQPSGAKVVEGQASVPRFPVFLGFRSEDDL